jgi:hypothetical protein
MLRWHRIAVESIIMVTSTSIHIYIPLVIKVIISAD